MLFDTKNLPKYKFFQTSKSTPLYVHFEPCMQCRLGPFVVHLFRQGADFLNIFLLPHLCQILVFISYFLKKQDLSSKKLFLHYTLVILNKMNSTLLKRQSPQLNSKLISPELALIQK